MQDLQPQLTTRSPRGRGEKLPKGASGRWSAIGCGSSEFWGLAALQPYTLRGTGTVGHWP